MHDDAFLYDLESDWFDADLPYWERLVAERRPRWVLDLACGTGRITFPLAHRGLAIDPEFRIVGLDISEPLLRRARERLAAADHPVRKAVTFVQGDMVEFELAQTFDLVIIGFNSLAYVIGTENQLSCLRSVRRHLSSGGQFAIDLIVPLHRYLAEAQGPPVPRLEITREAPERGVQRLLRFALERYNAATQVDETIYVYDLFYTDGRHERRTDNLAWHMYFPCELELLLRYAGLRVVERYGSYDRAPFGPRSMQYLWVMEAGATSAPPTLDQERPTPTT